MRQLIAATLVGLLPVSAIAQTMAAPIRVRITGVSGRYDVPGEVAIEGRRVVGREAATDEHFARYVNGAGERPISIVWPGTRLEGRAASMEGGVLTFVPDGDASPSFVPFNAISKIEMFRHRHSTALAIGTGVAVGAGMFLAAVAGVFSACGDDNSRCINRWSPMIWLVPPLMGGLVGRMVRGPSWRPVSPADFERELSRGQP